MKSLLVVFCAILAIVSADIWNNCGGPQDHLQIRSVSVTPDPPVIGQNLTIIATGNLDETVTSGDLHLLLQYSGITLLNNTFDLCTLISSYTHCPLAQGPISLTVTQVIPTEAIPGPYTGQVNIYDQNNSEVICIGLKFTLGEAGVKTSTNNKAKFN